MKTPKMNENPTVALRRLHRWRMALSGLAILIAGITIGAAGAVVVIRPVERRPPPDVDRAVAMMIGRFQDELDLSSEQVDNIRSILRRHMENLEKIRLEARPLIEAELQTMKTEIDAVLTAEQRNEWQRVTERLDHEFRRGMRRGGGDRRGGRRGGPPGRGDRPDGEPGEMRRPGSWRPDGFDPNGPRWMQERRGDPNGPFRRGSRPDWRDGQRRSFDQRSDPNRRTPEPNRSGSPPGPNDIPADPNSG